MKSVFGFRVRLGNPDLDFENLNPDFPIERTLNFWLRNALLVKVGNLISDGIVFVFHLAGCVSDSGLT